jgi:hypothetical protein
MLKGRTFADHVAAAGLCLLVIAVVDGSIEFFEFVTSINLWATCGLIGLGLLSGVYVVIGALEENSSLRRGLRRLRIWKRLRQRRKAVEAPVIHDQVFAGAR